MLLGFRCINIFWLKSNGRVIILNLSKKKREREKKYNKIRNACSFTSVPIQVQRWKRSQRCKRVWDFFVAFFSLCLDFFLQIIIIKSLFINFDRCVNLIASQVANRTIGISFRFWEGRVIACRWCALFCYCTLFSVPVWII